MTATDPSPPLLPLRLARRADRDGARPLLTQRGPGPARVELSGVTTQNWVAKVAALLVDECDVAPSDVVAVRLPLHWQGVVLVLASWAVGAAVDLRDGPPQPGSTVVATGPDGFADALAAGPGAVLGLSLDPLGAPLATVPPGVLDLGREALGQPDVLTVPPPPPGVDAILSSAGAALSASGLVARAAADAGRLGLGPDDRVLTVLPLTDDAGLWAGLLAPLAADAAVVLLPEPGGADLAAVCAEERVTASVGVTVPGVRRLDG